MTMSINTGLVSGMNTGQMVDQLMQLEAATQNALKMRLSNTTVTANAYRTVNSALASLTTAAELLVRPEAWTSAKGTSSSANVTVTAGTGASTGSLTFTVASLATTHSEVSTTRWASRTTAANLTDIAVTSLDGTTTKGTIALTGTETLDEAAAVINGRSDLGLRAAVVQTKPGEYALQLSAATSGEAAAFSLGGAETFNATTVGTNAELKVGTTTAAYSVTSPTNTFEGLLGGTTITVGAVETNPVTVSVAADPDAVAGKMAALVDSVNAALATIKGQTNNAPGSRATLRGEYAVTSIGSQLLQAVSHAVGGDGSPAQIGIQLTRDGTILFDKEKFAAALKDTPDLAQRLVAGSGMPGEPGAVIGIAGRIRDVTKLASDATTGSLTSLAKGQDSLARDIQNRIAAWDVRLEKRRQALTRQFTAMETALSSLSNQSNWLAGQLSSLPKPS